MVSTCGRVCRQTEDIDKKESIAVEAFGRHLKRVDASALFLFGCKIWPVKTYISIEKSGIAGVFLLACTFTDVLLFSLNSLWFAGKGLTGVGLFLADPIVMGPCDGTSGLVRGNRRKAVFAFKRLLSQWNLLRFPLQGARCCCVFRKCGKNRKSPSATRFSATKPQVAEA